MAAGPSQGLGQAGREPGSRDRAGVSSGAGGLRFLPAAWRVWGYQPARLPSPRHYAGGGGGHRADPGTFRGLHRPQGETALPGQNLLGALMARDCPSGQLAGPGWATSGESPAAPGLETLTGRKAPVVPPTPPHIRSNCIPPGRHSSSTVGPQSLAPRLIPKRAPECPEHDHLLARPGLEGQAVRPK